MSAPPPDDVIGMVGHELRSPLTSVLGYAQLLGAQELTDEQRRFVDVIERNGRRLLRTINELLVSAELSTGESDLARRRAGWKHVDLAWLARDCCDELGPASRAAGVSLTVAAPGPTPVTGAPELLAQAIRSLLGHAMRSTPRGGAVTIRVGLRAAASRDDGNQNGGNRGGNRGGAVPEAVIEVVDSGGGMGPDELGRLVEHLHPGRGDEGRRVFGVGLGLPVAQAIVDLHDGDLDVGSVPGEGTRVTVTLPTDPDSTWPAEAGSPPR